MSEITISNDRALIEFDRLASFIQNAYWGIGRTSETIRKSFDGALCFVALENGEQVGFARVITDGAVLGYICDVIVFEEHRGRGISKLIMQAILDHPDLQGLEGFMLATSDAQGLYEKFGFKRVGADNKYMRLTLVER
ncbi:MAG: GNAT family N-acetyltransferase [Rhizobiaceae bacterium]|nr:GNAT family N-acetyltransferase [Hyphomicrobiales bacterium]NRB32602.1 GNAT family N-acetyltransferase [Rhizobiaceae bacterium]